MADNAAMTYSSVGGAVLQCGHSFDAATDDRILDGYSEWLNEQMFAGKGEEDTLIWLGGNDWLIASNLDPGDLFVISIRRAHIVKPDAARCHAR